MPAFALAIPPIVEGILWIAGGAAVAGAAHQTLPGKAEREQSVSNLFGGSSSPSNEAMMMEGAQDGAGDDATPTAGSSADATNCVGDCSAEDKKNRKRYDKDGNEIISEERAGHILDGDAQGKGGGHRAGTGRPGKTEFPSDWTDDKILDAVSDVAQNGRVSTIPAHRPGEMIKTGNIDGVDIETIVTGSGSVRTGYPTGGRGVIKNPR